MYACFSYYVTQVMFSIEKRSYLVLSYFVIINIKLVTILTIILHIPVSFEHCFFQLALAFVCSVHSVNYIIVYMCATRHSDVTVY